MRANRTPSHFRRSAATARILDVESVAVPWPSCCADAGLMPRARRNGKAPSRARRVTLPLLNRRAVSRECIASSGRQSRTRRSSCALIATMTVLADISTAPIAGDNTKPLDANTPAASGIATML
jgi:hypothetical protein